MKRTVENIRDPLFRFFEREVNAGIQMLADVRRDIDDAIQICIGEKKQTNHHRILLAALAKSQLDYLVTSYTEHCFICSLQTFLFLCVCVFCVRGVHVNGDGGNPAEAAGFHGYGSECCGNTAGMDLAIAGFPWGWIFSAGTPREWSTNSAVKNFGVHTVFRQTRLMH